MDATVGYSGGTTQNPTYREVCTGRTAHTEVIRLEYDPAVISFADLLCLFGKMHSPGAAWRTDPNSQYRSAIYTTTPEQLELARAWKADLEASGKYRTVSTEITPARTFWEAEEYHQRYYEKHGLAARCPIPSA